MLAEASIQHDERRADRIQRTFDSALLESVANHPEVRPWLGMNGGSGEPLVLEPLVSDLRNYAGICAHGGFIAVWVGQGRYDVHAMFLPGTSAVGPAQNSMRIMFTETDCLTLLAKAPASNPRADALTRLLGFREVFRRDDAWTDADGQRVPISYRELTVSDWVYVSEEAEHAGRAVSAMGVPGNGSDDVSWYRALGGLAMMAEHGFLDKGLWVYNCRASHVDEPFAAVVPVVPGGFVVNDAVCAVRRGKVEVLTCR